MSERLEPVVLESARPGGADEQAFRNVDVEHVAEDSADCDVSACHKRAHAEREQKPPIYLMRA